MSDIPSTDRSERAEIDDSVARSTPRRGVSSPSLLLLAVAGGAGLGAALVVMAVATLDTEFQAMLLAAPVGAAAGLVAIHRFDLFVLGLLVIRPVLDAWNMGGTAGGALDPAAGAGAVFVATGMLWLIAQWRTGELVPPSFAVKALLVLCLAGFASTLVSLNPVMTAEANIRLLGGALMFAVLEQLMAQRRELPLRIVGVVLASAVIPIVAAVGQLASGEGISDLDGASRIAGTFAHPNPFGTYLVTVLLLSVAVATGQRGRWRLAAGTVAGFSGLILVFTYARGAWIGAVFGLAYLGFRHAKTLLIGLVIALVGVIVFIPSAVTRVTDLTEEREFTDSPPNSFAWRLGYWGDVIPLASSTPINGIGLEMVQHTMDSQLQPHNVFVQAYAEIGLVGLGAVIASIYGVGRALLERRRRAITQWDRTLSAAAMAVAIAYAVQLPTENLLTQGIAWWFLAAGATFGARPGTGSELEHTVVDRSEEHAPG